MAKALNWYDSVWLDKYLSAMGMIGEIAPSKLKTFVESFDILRTDPQFAVKEVAPVFDADALSEIRRIIKAIPAETLELHEAKRFGRFVVHDNPTFTRMQGDLVGRVSELVGEPVEPSYNFLSLYEHMGVCEPHLDAPSAKWTLDICIDQSDPWPIHFSQIVPWPETRANLGDDWQSAIKNDPQLQFQSKILTPGNGIVFSGSSQWHYRDPLPNRDNRKGFCDLLFFHYIPKGAGEVLSHRNWARLFDVPELADIPGINEPA